MLLRALFAPERLRYNHPALHTDTPHYRIAINCQWFRAFFPPRLTCEALAESVEILGSWTLVYRDALSSRVYIRPEIVITDITCYFCDIFHMEKRARDRLHAFKIPGSSEIRSKGCTIHARDASRNIGTWNRCLRKKARSLSTIWHDPGARISRESKRRASIDISLADSRDI